MGVGWGGGVDSKCKLPPKGTLEQTPNARRAAGGGWAGGALASWPRPRARCWAKAPMRPWTRHRCCIRPCARSRHRPHPPVPVRGAPAPPGAAWCSRWRRGESPLCGGACPPPLGAGGLGGARTPRSRSAPAAARARCACGGRRARRRRPVVGAGRAASGRRRRQAPAPNSRRLWRSPAWGGGAGTSACPEAPGSGDAAGSAVRPVDVSPWFAKKKTNHPRDESPSRRWDWKSSKRISWSIQTAWYCWSAFGEVSGSGS